MIKLKSLIPESFFKSFEASRIGTTNYVEIFKNPNEREVKECMRGDEFGSILFDKDIYIWNRNKALHVEVMRHIQPNMRDLLPVLITLDGNDCAVYVTDASKYTKWYRQPETWNYIQNHPFFKFRNIEDISYWDEDINGKWDDSKDEGPWMKDMGLTESKNKRFGRCYELAGRYVSSHHDAVLVHGELINKFTVGHPKIEHAWVEEGNEIFDPVMDRRFPKTVYEGIFQPVVHKKYSWIDVIKITNKTGNWGPWDTQ